MSDALLRTEGQLKSSPRNSTNLCYAPIRLIAVITLQEMRAE
jgi:hypothetical protein